MNNTLLPIIDGNDRALLYALAEVLVQAGIINSEQFNQSYQKWQNQLQSVSPEPPSAFPTPRPDPAIAEPLAPREIKTIMIVDDVAFIREMIKRTLVINGYIIVAEANNGKEAVDQFQKLKPDMVLMDIEMKGMNGLEALRNIRGINPHVPVVIMTGNPQKDYVKEALRFGSTDFLVKPIDVNRLLNVMNKITGKTNS